MESSSNKQSAPSTATVAAAIWRTSSPKITPVRPVPLDTRATGAQRKHAVCQATSLMVASRNATSVVVTTDILGTQQSNARRAKWVPSHRAARRRHGRRVCRARRGIAVTEPASRPYARVDTSQAVAMMRAIHAARTICIASRVQQLARCVGLVTTPRAERPTRGLCACRMKVSV